MYEVSSKLFGVATVVLSITAAYHYIISVPRQEQIAHSDAHMVEQAYHNCINNSKELRRSEWDSFCDANNMRYVYNVYVHKNNYEVCEILPTVVIDEFRAHEDKRNMQCLAEMKAGIKISY